MADKSIDYKDHSLEDLRKEQEKIQGFIQRRLETRKRDAIHQIQTIIREHDLGYDEVVTAIRTITKRGKAVAIYRNPAKPRQTWSGMGEAPTWFVTAEDPEALRIPGSE